MREKSAKRLYRISAVLLGILLFFAALLVSLLIADEVCERSAHAAPSYAKEDISALLDQKEEWTEEEFHYLFRQTGLGKSALIAMKSQYVYENGRPVPLSKRVQPFQDALFYNGEKEHELVSYVSKRDLMKDFTAPVAPMEAGDVLVNSSTHTLGYRNGHAALVLDEFGTVLESFEYGQDSSITTNGHLWFAKSSNFILLRLKGAGARERSEIAENAKKYLRFIPYDLTVGIFSKKDQGTSPKSTHCSHLVWQAYKNAGYDVDANGGLIVAPRDLARSPLFEVVQVYGFDPETLW